MRRLGYRTVDMLVDRITGPPGPVVRSATPEELHERLAMPPPEHPVGFDEILEGLERDVLPFVARISHPGYLAFIPGEGTWPGALGDLIASALNVDTCWWLGASGPSALELVVLDWFRQWVGLSGAGCRRARVGRLGGEPHRARLRARGADRRDGRSGGHLHVRSDALVAGAGGARARLPARSGARDPDRPAGAHAARCAAERDRRRPGRRAPAARWSSRTPARRPPVRSIRSTSCRRSAARTAIWLHVDGAYGAFACLSERGREALAGMELADSITLDPHKWLYQPIELGALLVRDGSALRRGFEISPDYLKDIEAADREVNFSDLGLQLTRSCRALKLWISLRYFGVAAFRQAIDRCLDLALHAQSRIESSSELELMSPASLGVVTFRRHPAGIDNEATLERINASLAEQIERGGEVFVSTGRVRGRYVLRLCVLNHSTSQAEVDRALELAASLEVDLASGRAHRGARELPGARGRLARAARRSTPTACARCRCSPPWTTSRPSESCSPRTSTLRWPAKRSWSSGRSAGTSTSILSGAVEVVADGKHAGHARPGRVLRRAGRDRVGSGLRAHALGHGDRDRADAPARPRLGARQLADEGRPAFGERLEQASRERLATL